MFRLEGLAAPYRAPPFSFLFSFETEIARVGCGALLFYKMRGAPSS